MKKLIIKKDKTIRQKVYHHIREEILKGTIAPKDRLIEAKIAEEIGTSRTPVREALHNLELEKLVISIPRVGYVVRGMDMEEVEQLCEIRARHRRPRHRMGREETTGQAYPVAKKKYSKSEKIYNQRQPERLCRT